MHIVASLGQISGIDDACSSHHDLGECVMHFYQKRRLRKTR